MRIALGSRNPAKIEAARKVTSAVWKDAELIAIDVPSNVSDQPRSDQEAIRGALNRAKLSREKTGSDIGIGIEGCTVENEFGMFLSGWAVVVDSSGRVGIGSGIRMLLPERLALQVRSGKELGPLTDETTGQTNLKRQRGVVGILTNNMITRINATESSIVCALARFLNPKYYE